MTTVVFWQEALSIHRAPMIRELSLLEGFNVHAVSFGSVSQARQAMGWKAPDYGQATVHIFEPSDWQNATSAVPDADVHVLAGFGAWPGVREAQIHLARASSALMFVLTEPWDDRGFKGFLRLLRANRRVKQIAPYLAGVLPCGPRAKRQLQRFRALRSTPMYDFGYFVNHSATAIPPPPETPRLIFVGKLAEWKKPLLLIRALSTLRNLDWHLDMYGRGDQLSDVQHEIASHGLQDRVQIHDYLPYNDIRKEIATSDVLILPSAHDGWGAVINEALIDGTRVVVSDAAGASDLVTHDMLGQCFQSEDQASLEIALRHVLSMSYGPETRKVIKTWSSETMSPKAAANYFQSILMTLPRPIEAPWKAVSPTAYE